MTFLCCIIRTYFLIATTKSVCVFWLHNLNELHRSVANRRRRWKTLIFSRCSDSNAFIWKLRKGKNQHQIINSRQITGTTNVASHFIVHFLNASVCPNCLVVLLQRHKRFPQQNIQIVRHQFGVRFNRFHLVQLLFDFSLKIQTNRIGRTFGFRS